MRLSPHFTLGEMTRSETASRLRIANVPNEEELSNLKALCILLLERVRAHFAAPVLVSSGYRSPEVNRRIGGSAKSQHMQGEAVDFSVAGVDHLTVARYVAEHCDYDQLIIEFCSCDVEREMCRGWVHVSYRTRTQNRKQILRYRHGLPVQILSPEAIPEAAG